ncbi:hypothetical protein BH11BAC5_BH11BAC5_00030 [soil metagenome]
MISCGNYKKNVINNAEEFKELTSINIHFYPSFTNQCDLQIDRKTDSATITVDSMLFVEYGKLKNSISLKKMETKTQIKDFYDTSFLKTIRFDTTKLPINDGISLLIHYSDGHKTDSIYTGNNLSQKLRKNMKQQLEFLKEQANNKKLKKYLMDLSQYFD